MVIISGASSWTKSNKNKILIMQNLLIKHQNLQNQQKDRWQVLINLTFFQNKTHMQRRRRINRVFKEMPIDKTAMAKAVEALKEKAKELKDIFDKGFWDGFNNGGEAQELLHTDH